MIDRFENDYAFLSNFYRQRFAYKGIWYATAEHAFQAAKAKFESDRIYVQEALTPGQAKRRGHKVALRDDWEISKLSVMLEIVQAKFETPKYKQRLAATRAHELVEGNYWHDNFWGSCFCEKCDNLGKNYLGKILMHIRSPID